MSNLKFTPLQIIILVGLAVLTCVIIGFSVYFVYTTSLPTPTPTPAPAKPVAPTQPPAATQAETPTPEPTPTEEITDEVWERVKQSGKLVVGTSADYPPFEYYTPQFKLDGFDIALMRAIGLKLGLELEFKDMVFTSLFPALGFKQIDTAVAAISLTPERQSLLYFSNIYMISQDATLARENSPITIISRVEEYADKVVGVQQNSVYERWLREELVNTGQMPGTFLRVYPQIDRAVLDLKEGRLDLVLMDLLPAQQSLTLGGLKIVGQGLNLQEYAVAMPYGAGRLQVEINRTLTELYNEGILSKLAQEHLGVSPDQILPPVAPTPGPLPPTPTPSGKCLDGMEFVQDLTYPDFGMTNPPEIPPGTPFKKGWRIRNIGTCTWNSSYVLTYVGGNTPASKMGGLPTAISGTIPPGAEYDMYVDLVSPLLPGIYQGFWQLKNGEGNFFGERLWVGIKVTSFNPATPSPEPGTPVIQRFDVYPNDQIDLGQCVDVSWKVEGQVNNIKIFRNDLILRDGAPKKGNLPDCPSTSGQMIYRVEAAGPGGTSSAADDVLVAESLTPAPPESPTPTMTPEVWPTPTDPPPPTIAIFEVQPGQITVGQCVDISWKVDGGVDLIQIKRNELVILDDAADAGQASDCPTEANSYTYKIEATNTSTGESASSEKSVTVKPIASTLNQGVLAQASRLGILDRLFGLFAYLLPGIQFAT